MFKVETASNPATCHIWVWPNRSLSPRGSLLAFSIIAASSLTVVGVLALQGLWVPLPFAGLELSLLGATFVWLNRQGRQHEEIRVSADQVAVRQSGPGQQRRETFHPGWLRVELRAGRHQWYPRRLVLSSAGREVEVGAFLNEAERERLAGVLDDTIGAPYRAHWHSDAKPSIEQPSRV